MTPTEALKAKAIELGFDAVGVAAIDPPLAAAARFEEWLAAGRQGGMDWLAGAEHRERRADPARLCPGLAAVLVVALVHDPGRDAARDARVGRIARYAHGEDYHRLMQEKLGALERWTRSEWSPGSRALWYSDTGAILERGWAERAGLGWVGKHSGVLSQDLGSWFLLGVLLVDRPLDPDPPLAHEHCGTCTRCLDACPTRAIVAPYQVDARLCVSYLTIENAGAIPVALRPGVGDWVFGCDVCQEVCPWNRFARPAAEARLHARGLEGWTLEGFLALDRHAFERLFEGSPIRRAGRAGFLRNVCVALGNRAGPDSAAALLRALERDPDALVRAHAAWALGEVLRRNPADPGLDRYVLTLALERAGRDDRDDDVRDEAAAALAVAE